MRCTFARLPNHDVQRTAELRIARTKRARKTRVESPPPFSNRIRLHPCCKLRLVRTKSDYAIS